MKNQNRNILISIPAKVVVVLALLVLSVATFVLLAKYVVFEKKDWFDSHAFDFFRSRATLEFLHFSRAISFFGSPYFLFPAYIALIICLLLLKRRTDAINIGIVGVTSTLVSRSLKSIIGRPRPDDPHFEPLTNYSFPSGHAFSSFVFSSVLIWLLWKTRWHRAWKIILTILLLLFSFAIGISRISLRYHYASDVLAGYCAAIAWVLVSLWLQRRFFSK